MPKRVAISTLNASTIDIVNTIRQNADAEYRRLVPEVAKANDIPKVGEVLLGYPALANTFLTALLNRIAIVKIRSAIFNNPFEPFKKGYLETGETIEEVFVNITKAREFSVEKAPGREFRRTPPDVRAAFHAMNWRVQYPVTIQNEDLRMAFTSIDGVTDMIAKIVDAVYTSDNYDEYLLFKYLIIKAVSHGKMYAVGVDQSAPNNNAKAFRGYSNLLTFMSNKYNVAGVTTVTPREDQYIFMDSMFNAEYDVDVLASAFNMDKATFQGHLRLVDDWTTFDTDRFSEIRENSNMIEDVTAAELALMANVKAVVVDSEWFQVYDNLTMFTEKYVASGLYWNYFLNIWRTFSTSPFSNAICYVDNAALEANTPPTSIGGTLTLTVTAVERASDGTATITLSAPDTTTYNMEVTFVQDQAATTAGVAVHRYGAYVFPENYTAGAITPVVSIGGTEYTASASINPASTAVNSTISVTIA